MQGVLYTYALHYPMHVEPSNSPHQHHHLCDHCMQTEQTNRDSSSALSRVGEYVNKTTNCSLACPMARTVPFLLGGLLHIDQRCDRTVIVVSARCRLLRSCFLFPSTRASICRHAPVRPEIDLHTHPPLFCGGKTQVYIPQRFRDPSVMRTRVFAQTPAHRATMNGT